MTTPILHKRSAVTSTVPTTAQLTLGEVALNTADGRAFMRRVSGGTDEVVSFLTSRYATTAIGTVLRLQVDAFAAENTDLPGTAVINLSANYHNNNLIGASSASGVYLCTDSSFSIFAKASGQGLGNRSIRLNIDGTMEMKAANSTAMVRVPRTFVQSGDPGAAAADGDLWVW